MPTLQTSPTSHPEGEALLGPYSTALPGALTMLLGLRPGAGNTHVGWQTDVAGAHIELGYNYTGLEERVAAGGLDWGVVPGLVEQLCGGCSQANVLAYVQAVEDMAGARVPPRAAYLRMVLVEAERVTSHLLNIAEIATCMQMPELAQVLRDLRERIVHTVAGWTGARFNSETITYGGISRDMDEMESRSLALASRSVERALRAHTRMLINSREVAERLSGMGKISGREAAFAGLRGPVARAAGVAGDIRANFPTGAYEDEGVTIVVQRGGDAYSRLVVRLLECLESLRIIEQALDDLPGGPVRARGGFELGTSGAGIGRVEGPRGEVFCWAQGNREALTSLHISTGSAPTMGVLPGLVLNAPVDDLALMLTSLDICRACAER